MRKKLKQENGKRLAFVAVVERFGTKNGFKGMLPTILLKDVKLLGSDEVITDHIWFTKGKSWDACKEGSIVSFHARVGVYTKGYKGRDMERMIENPVTRDYRLERPTKVTLVEAK